MSDLSLDPDDYTFETPLWAAVEYTTTRPPVIEPIQAYKGRWLFLGVEDIAGDEDDREDTYPKVLAIFGPCSPPAPEVVGRMAAWQLQRDVEAKTKIEVDS